MIYRPARVNGFTLIELLIVFAIAGGVVTLIPIAFDKYRESTQYKKTVRDLTVGLRSARMLAGSKGQEKFFQVDLINRTYGIDGETGQNIPETVQIRAMVADQEMGKERGVVSILFMPSGGSTGGSLDVIRHSGVGTRVKVDWLTSRVEIEPIIK